MSRIGPRLPALRPFLSTSPHFRKNWSGLKPYSSLGAPTIDPTIFSRGFFSSTRTSNAASSTQEPNTSSSHQPPKRLINSSKWVGYWLAGTSGLVFGIVVLGGLTRLTESGLSITEWRPVTGTLPPMCQKEWEEEFAKYKASPEFKQINSHIDLDEFKFIFFMEWIHRLWGRAIGVVFVVPAAYFALARKTSARVNRRLFGLACLLGFQGFIGWWMVQSGLDRDDLEARKSKPTVSPYRLATHLGCAFLLYMGMIWTGLEILKERKWVKDPAKALEMFKILDNPLLRPVRKISLGVLALTFCTAMSGALVAGLDAGWIYNTFPKMGDNWIPSNRELMDTNFARKEDNSDLWWRNLLENPTTVQFNHRIFGITTFCTAFALHMYCTKKKRLIPKVADRTVKAMMGLVTLQVGLGITTLLWLVPIPLASAHQAGALAVFTSAIVFASQLRKPRIPMKILINGLHMQELRKGGSKILNEAAKHPKWN